MNHALLKFLAFTLFPFYRSRIQFNRKLFQALIRRNSKGKSDLKAPAGEPEVILEQGPIDGILGQYDPIAKKIHVDVLEIFLKTFQEKGHPGKEKDFIDSYDRNLTHVLAHEGGHWRLDRRHGRIALAEKYALHLGFIVIGGLIAYWYGGHVIRSITNMFHSTGHSLIEQTWIKVIFAAINLLFLIYLVRHFTRIWFRLSIIASYNLCWHERSANAYAKEICDDPKWQEVITIKANPSG